MARAVPSFHDFVGQRRHVAYLRRQLEGVQARNVPFPHALFIGPSGVGKTRLARALACEMGTQVASIMGYVDRPVLAEKLSQLDRHDILLVDEAHRLRHPAQELITEAVDQGSLPARDPGPAGERVALKPWTLILATDQPGALLDALLKRVVVRVQLDYYDVAELKGIVEAMAGQPEIGVLVSPQAAKLVAEVSGGLPRRARHHLQQLRNFCRDADRKEVGTAEVRAYLESGGYDERGLDLTEGRYMEALSRMGTGSLESIALALGIDEHYVKREVESQLVRRGLVRIGASGRQLTEAGRAWADRAGRKGGGPRP
jgi:Holliday junction DNA helicase RuvB